MQNWIDYYDADPAVYVGARHRAVHFRIIADDIIAAIPGTGARVLDYSCGEALEAARIAARCGELVLFEPAPGLRQRLRARFAGNANIVVIDPGELERRPDASLDLIVMISVTQYMTQAELVAALALFRRVLAKGGRLLVGDVVPKRGGAAADVIALLRLAAREGFLWDAVTGLVRMALSDYRRMRGRAALARYGEDELIALLAACGFRGERLPENVGYNPARMSFSAVAV